MIFTGHARFLFDPGPGGAVGERDLRPVCFDREDVERAGQRVYWKGSGRGIAQGKRLLKKVLADSHSTVSRSAGFPVLAGERPSVPEGQIMAGFNQDIRMWDSSNVKPVYYMFHRPEPSTRTSAAGVPPVPSTWAAWQAFRDRRRYLVFGVNHRPAPHDFVYELSIPRSDINTFRKHSAACQHRPFL